MDAIGLPLILLGAVWGAFSPILKAIEMMNERRDKILDPDSTLTVAHRWLMLYSDWLAIMIATYVFAAFIGSLIFIAPQFANIAHVEIKSKAKFVFDTVGTIFVVTATVGVLTSIFDFLAMRQHLVSLQEGRAKWTMEEVALQAYYLWESEGHQEGRSAEYWARAEERLRCGRTSGTNHAGSNRLPH